MREFATALPKRMQGLPVDRRGYPVPKFVQWIEGEPDFRVMDPKHLGRCVRVGLCWVCGDRLGQHKAFVIGPMCCINRISSEPPSHYECAAFAAQVCPFLTKPMAKRRDANMPTNVQAPAGIMLEHNPGLAALWVTDGYDLMRLPEGVLFKLHEPTRLEFWREGRKADRAEVNAAIRLGFPNLERMAQREGPQAVRELMKEADRFYALLAKHLPITEAA